MRRVALSSLGCLVALACAASVRWTPSPLAPAERRAVGCYGLRLDAADSSGRIELVRVELDSLAWTAEGTPRQRRLRLLGARRQDPGYLSGWRTEAADSVALHWSWGREGQGLEAEFELQGDSLRGRGTTFEGLGTRTVPYTVRGARIACPVS